MKITNFVTPPEHINFLAKNLLVIAGEIINGSIVYFRTHEHDHLGRFCLFNYVKMNRFG